MSTKKSHQAKVGTKWPKTKEALQKEKEYKQHVRQQHTNKLATLAQVSQIMTAASSVPSARVKRLVKDAAQEALSQAPLSKNKQEKDTYFQDNNAWDEVTVIRQDCLSLLRVIRELSPLLASQALVMEVTNKKLLTRNIQAICRDTETLANVIDKVYQLHKDKTGGTKNQEEMLYSCEVYSQYVDFMERYEAALLPIIVHASEQLQEALLVLHEKDPVTAQQLNSRLQNTLNAVQHAIHDNTGADDSVSPNQVADLPEAAAVTA